MNNGQDLVPPNDIFGPVAVFPEMGRLTVLLLLAAVFAWFAWWYWKKSRKRLAKIPLTPAPKPADDEMTIWRRFDELTPVEPFAEEHRQNFYGALTEILRSALARRLDDPLVAATTAELRVRLVVRSPLSVDDTHQLLGFLEAADHVKFARRVATRDEALHGKEEVRRWLIKILPRSGAPL